MDPLNRFPRVVQEYYVDKVRAVEAEADARKFGMKTKADALAYQAGLRKKMRKVFGRMPRRTPLKPVLMDVLERDGYRIEKLIIESRPNFPVTVNLYIPQNAPLPAPCVLAPCGHSLTGKAEPAYQSFSQGLVKKGYVVLIYDPISQGERLQYMGEDWKTPYGVGVGEHIHAADQQLLVGEFFGSWRVWDGIRSLDYLLTREEIDPTRVGLTGNSGGGTLTTLLLANDDRFAMAGPGCYVTTTRRNTENELPADSEQIPPGLLAMGMDLDDMLACHAPKPLILLTQEKDYFDQRGALEAFARLKHLYKLLGAPDNVAMKTGPDGHGYGQPLREAMYAFFNKHSGTTASGKEPVLTIEDEETLRCTATGQVHSLRPRTVFSSTLDDSAALAANRKGLRGDDLKRALTKLLALPKRSGPPEYRTLRPSSGREYPSSGSATYAVETEPGALSIVTMLGDEAHAARPPRGKAATLYVSHESADAELRDDPLLGELAGADARLFAMDFRGVGDSLPNTCGVKTYHHPYGNDYFYASLGILLSEPYIGRRVHDILSVVDFLAEYGYKRVHLSGCGRGSIPALFAATLDARVKQVTLKNCPLSYHEIAEDEHYAWPCSSMLPDVLKTLDLPDCYRAVARKDLRIIDPWDANMQPLAKGTTRRRLKELKITAKLG